jgi:hypothetical protein
MEKDKTVYHSKIGVSMILILLVLIGGVAVLLMAQKMWMGLIPLLLVSAYIAHLFLNTYYIIDGQKLRIRCGFFVNRTIDISSIRKITPTHLMMSAPAVSLDRLEILYNGSDSVLISPKDKEGFVRHLKSIKPEIETHLN